MKIFLLILVVSTKAGQQPTMEQILQPDMATCQAQAKIVREELRQHGCDKNPFNCDPGYTVHTSCVTGS
jgi:hypothetical protein